MAYNVVFIGITPGHPDEGAVVHVPYKNKEVFEQIVKDRQAELLMHFAILKEGISAERAEELVWQARPAFQEKTYEGAQITMGA